MTSTSIPAPNPATTRARTRDDLVAEHLALVRQLAVRYAHRNQPLDDLVQAGCIGLLKAADGFDPEQGTAFAAFAAKHIIGEMRRHFRDHGWFLHTPRPIQELHLRLGPVTEELTQRLGRLPTAVELAEATGESVAAVRQALAAGVAYRAAPLDATAERGADAIRRHADETARAIDQLLDRSILRPCIAALDERSRVLLRLRFVEGLTQTEIAARIGVSQVQVSRLLSRTLDELRSTLAAA